MIRVYILRHGEAEPYRLADETRELTRRGIRDAQAAGTLLQHQGVKFDQIFSSPYTRTRQTRQHFLLGYGQPVPVTEKDWLTPDNEASRVVSQLSGEDLQGRTILLVSHMPLVSGLVAYLVDGQQANRSHYPMVPASLAELSMESCHRGMATLHQLLSPPYP